MGLVAAGTAGACGIAGMKLLSNWYTWRHQQRCQQPWWCRQIWFDLWTLLVIIIGTTSLCHAGFTPLHVAVLLLSCTLVPAITGYLWLVCHPQPVVPVTAIIDLALVVGLAVLVL